MSGPKVGMGLKEAAHPYLLTSPLWLGTLEGSWCHAAAGTVAPRASGGSEIQGTRDQNISGVAIAVLKLYTWKHM